jgi:hypothetical protein
MKDDVRDDRLGRLMEDSVRGIRPVAEGRLHDVLRRGGRRRTARWTATGVALAVFVGAVVWGAANVGGRRIEPMDTREWATAGSLESTGWSFAYPPDWRIQDLPACPNAPERTGGVVTDSDFEFRNPQGGAPGCEARLVLEGFPSDAVAMAVMPVGVRVGIVVPTPDSPFPISWDQLEPTGVIEGGPAASYLGVTAGGDRILFVRTWIGPDAPAGEVDELTKVLGTLEVTGAAHWTTSSDPINGFSVTYPDDWMKASQSLTPELSDPHEILSLGTYPLRPGGKACIDAYLPGNALADLGTGDVFITLQAASGQGMPPRPAAFGPDAARIAFDGLPACDGYGALSLRGWWFAFADQGTGFYAFVALGPGVAHDAQVERLVWHVLDSLRFQPG